MDEIKWMVNVSVKLMRNGLNNIYNQILDSNKEINYGKNSYQPLQKWADKCDPNEKKVEYFIIFIDSQIQLKMCI